MSTENNEQVKEEKNPPNEPQQIEPSSQPLISEDIKKLLNSLLKKSLDKRIIRLEARTQDQIKTAALVKKNYDGFNNQLKHIVKNMEETLKKKEAKSKEEAHKKGKASDRHPLASKSVPPGKLGIKTKDINKSKVEKKKHNIHTNNLKTEENIDKDAHKRAKSFKEKRILSEANIKKGGKTKLMKKTQTSIPPFGKEDDKEDIKAKTLSYYHTERNVDSKKKIK